MVTRNQAVSATGFTVKLQAQKGDTVPGLEKVAYMALMPETGNLHTVSRTGNEVTHRPFKVSFNGARQKPMFFAGL